MATEPGEYEFLMPVKVRVSDDRIRYITFGVPRAGDKVKDQIIQLRQLDSSMFSHKNCFPMPAPFAATPGAAAVVAASVSGGVLSLPDHVLVGENGVLRQGSPLAGVTAPHIRLPAPRPGAPKILTIPQPPPFPVNATASLMPPGSAPPNGMPVNATLVSNSLSLPGLVNGVAVVNSNASAVPKLPQQQLLQTAPLVSLPPKPVSKVTVAKAAAPVRSENGGGSGGGGGGSGGASGSSLSAVATVLNRFKCNECDSVYNNRDSIVAHIYTHMKVRPFKCALCNSIAAMSKTILKHLAKEHGTNDSSLILEQRIPNESTYYSEIQ